MAVLWTPDLATGNATIDAEHKELFAAINRVMEACSKGQGRAVLEETIRFMESYVEKHFSHEEQLQQKCKYPDYVNHKKWHEGYKKVVAEIDAQIKKEGPSIALVGKVNAQIAGALATHIKTEDKKLAAFMKSQGVS